MITYAAGDLLQADAAALVNTVNCVGVMGKGIALQFKHCYPQNFHAYEKACRRGEVTVGTMFVTETGHLDRPRYVINFPTKKHWREPSRLSYIDAGLIDLIRVLRDHAISSVAIPPLGVGNGGLDWAHVEPRLLQALQQVPDIHAILYAPTRGHVASPGKRRPPAGVAQPSPVSDARTMPRLEGQAPITKAERETILGYNPNTGV